MRRITRLLERKYGVPHRKREGDPIEILIQMSNSAGIFQVQETLGRKVIGSPLEPYIKIVAYTSPEKISLDKRVVHRIYLEGKAFRQGQLIPP